jgi:hypothetical protein
MRGFKTLVRPSCGSVVLVGEAAEAVATLYVVGDLVSV